MSIEKRATATFTNIRMLNETSDDPSGMVMKLAATKLSIDANHKAKQVIDAEITKHPSALFFRAKAIAADETNSNGDYFSSEELIKAAQSFVGVPFYTNHENTDITKAKGKLVFSEWDPKEKAIYVIGFIDREAYPQLCRGVEQDYMRGVSMGCVVEHSKCSICNNSAATVEEYCPHVKFRKGRTFSGTAKDVVTGEIKNFKNAPVYEKNFGVRFIELSGVGDPACKSCFIEGVYENGTMSKAASCNYVSTVGHGNGFISKVASVQNSLLMYQGTQLYKQASQEELQQIDQVLSTLENISVKLIQNRKRVEVEFASDLVKILSELQEFADELTGAGYGQLQDEPTAGGADPTAGLEGLGSIDSGNELSPGPADGIPNSSGLSGMPTSSPEGGDLGIIPTSESMGEEIGSVSGSPSKSMFKMPTAPKMPLASNDNRFMRVAGIIADITAALDENNDQNNGEESMNRRTPWAASKERASVKQALSSTKENETFSKNIHHYDSSAKLSGGTNMDSINQTASRTAAPGVLSEKQLNNKRTDVEQDSTQQVQLDGKRKNSDPQCLQETLIEGSRVNNTPSILPERQLDALRKNNEPTDTQQVQLEQNRTRTEQETVTESQLDNKPSSLWERTSMNRKTIKTAKQHAKSVIRVLAESAVRCSATPQQIKVAASTLVDGSKTRTSTLDSITYNAVPESAYPSTLSVVARARYWGGKGVVMASATDEDVARDIVAGLRTLIAMDEEISPEAVIDVLDVVSEDDLIKTISDEVDNVMTESKETEKAASISMKKQIRQAMLGDVGNVKQVNGPREYKPSDVPGGLAKKRREEERNQMKQSLASKKPTHIIEASLQEVGTTMDEIANHKLVAKQKIVDFVKIVAGMKNLTVQKRQANVNGKPVLVASTIGSLRIANITNVTVDGTDGTIQIAIQTDDGNTTADVSIPLNEQGTDVANAPMEGDATGTGLDDLIGQNPPAAPAPESPLPTTASSRNVTKTAQFGGSAGGLPGGGNLGGAQDPGSAIPQGTPAMDEGGGLQNFTQDEGEGDESAPGVGEQMMPGSICPICHSTDTTTGEKDLPAGAFVCNNCSAVYEVHVNIEVLNPEKMSFQKGDSSSGITEPTLPEMPVAASIKLDKNSLQKIASCEAKYGHVCPACGMTECKPQEKTAGNVTYVCPSCQTKSTKEILIAGNKDAFLQIQWDLNPKKVFSAECTTCKQAAIEYAALIKVSQMMQKSAQANSKPETAFPEANCAEYIAKRFGANAVATFGPCKGKALATCVCKQLKAFGLRKRYHIEKLASVYTQPDPMDKCLELQKNKGYKEIQASTICNAIKVKYAKEADNNEWLEAFAGDSQFTTEELRVMKQKSNDMLNKKAQFNSGKGDELDFDVDISAPLDDVQSVGDSMPESETVEETVTIEIPDSLAKDLAKQIEVQTEEVQVEGDTEDEEVSIDLPEDLESNDDMPIQAGNKQTLRTAGTPRKVEDISSGVAGKLKSGNGTIGKEQPFSAQKPTIPSRGDASKIKGEKDSIPGAMLPDIPQDSSYMGDENRIQKGMPSINIDMRGRVASESKGVQKVAKTPTKVEDISSGVAGKLKSGNGTIGKEEAFDAKAPNIPEAGSKAKIGGEKDTIPESQLPDIPADHATIGGEAETMKGTPDTNLDIRGRVLAESRRDQQLSKISAARHKKACQVVAKLMGLGHIAESDFDAVVEDLAKIEVDRIEAFAEKMYKNVRTASVAPVTLSTPIVREASVYSPSLPKPEKTMAQKLQGIFTPGSQLLAERIHDDDLADEARGSQEY